MDRERLRLFGENIRTFLLSKKSREVLVFLFFLLVSAGFWLLQTLQEEYETEIHIPLSLSHVPTGVVITSELPSEVTVTVKDRGTTLLGYWASDDERKIDVDFSAHDLGVSSDHILLSHSEVQKLTLRQLLPSTRVLGIRPDTIDYYYTRGIQKRVPVVFRGHVEVAPLYYLAHLKVSPDTVTVWGSEQLLDSLTILPTVVTNISDLSESLERKIAVAVPRGMKAIPSEVTLSADVDVYTEKQVKVPIIGTNFPAGYALRTFPASATITFRVGSKDYKNITSDNFVLTATYEELLESPDSMLTLRLRSVPDGVSQVRITPAAVQYLIEQNQTEE